MKILNKLQDSFEKKSSDFIQYLDRLSVRERVMVIFTTIFVFVAAVGYSLWKMHDLAEREQRRVNELKDTLVWMQSNAVTMKVANQDNLSKPEKIQRIAQQQGLSVTSQQLGSEQIQLSVQHQNYAILANFLMQLTQSGLSVKKMDMVSNSGQITLTATIQ